MRIITTVAFTVFTAFFISSNAMAVTVTNTDKCIVTPCIGTDCQYDAINSVSDQCTSITYTVVKHAYDASEDAGKEYGIYADCSECPSGYYVSDSKVSIPHGTCGKIQYYSTCAQPSKCQGTPPTTAAASTVSNCASASKATFGKTTYYTCNTCNSGYTRTAVTVSDARCTNTTTKYTCVADEPDCDETTCVSNPAWACGGPLGDGVCARTYRSCVNNKCVAATYWQCKDGYYGTPLIPESDVHECTKCPQTSDNVTVSTYNPKYQLPASTGTKITDCYVTGGSDITGSFKYTQKTSDTPYTCTYNN